MRERERERESEREREILRSERSHALDRVPLTCSPNRRTKPCLLWGGMSKMLPTVTIMRDMMEHLLFQGLPILIHSLERGPHRHKTQPTKRESTTTTLRANANQIPSDNKNTGRRGRKDVCTCVSVCVCVVGW